MFISTLASFFINRNDNLIIEKNKRSDYLIYSLLLYFFLCFLLLWGFKFADQFIGLPPHKIYGFMRDHKWYTIILLMLVIGPLLEEISFRLFLRFTPLNISLSFAGLCYYIISTFTQTKYYSLDFFTGIKVVISFFLAFGLYRLTMRQSIQRILENFWRKRSLMLVYSSIVIFALIHLGNMEDINRKHIFLFPLLISPQLLIAFFASYLRLKCGFKFAIYFHIGANLIPVLLLLLVKFYS